MNFRQHAFNILICLILLPGITSCGGEKSKSHGAEVEIIPEKPIVITADTKDGSGNDVKAPWFEFRMRINNNTGHEFTIVAVSAEIFAQGSSGQPETKIAAWTPSDFDFSLDEDTECKFSSFGTWEVGASQVLVLKNGIDACERIPKFMVGDNLTGITGKNYRYRVRVKPLGWFGTELEPEDRFEKVETFFTQ